MNIHCHSVVAIWKDIADDIVGNETKRHDIWLSYSSDMRTSRKL